MIDLNKCEGWQKRDTNGMVMPWYTHSALEEISKWDLTGASVFEYGCGQSTLWWLKKAFYVRGVESNKEWADAVGVVHYEDKEKYINCVREFDIAYDIIVIDGEPVEWRDDCIRAALEYLKPGGVLVVDNYLQPSVWMASEETQRILTALEHKIYKQEGHPDWATAIFYKP